MKIKRIFWPVLFLALLFSACSAQSSGPLAWIDQPLDGSSFPLQPVALTAHASDSDGVASFEISLNDELLQTVSAGGSRLGEAAWEWLPPGPGEYTIQVVAIDSQGNRGPEAEALVIITGFALDPAQAPLQETLQAAIDQIECLADQTVAISFSISSPLGIESYEIWSTWVDVKHSETFQDPLPTTISKTVNITEPIQDEIDRNHQWGLKVVLPGLSDPYFFYALEPDGRCPGHYQAVVVAENPDLVDPDRVKARQNTACRLGPDGKFDISGYLLLDESAAALGKLADGSWVQVEIPETGYICWIAANLLDYDPSLLESLPDIVPPPLPATVEPEPTATTAPDTTAPVISGLNSSPDLILTQSGGCAAYSRTTTVQAGITDNLGVSSASAVWSIGGENGTISLIKSGGTYQGVIGPVSTVGSLTITVQAWDSAGNTSSAAAPTVTVQNCIE